MRTDIKGSRRPCATPGCGQHTQTGEPLCHSCRDGRAPHAADRDPEPATEPCRETSCDRPARALGYCDSHYRQFRKYGRTGKLQDMRPNTLPEDTAEAHARTLDAIRRNTEATQARAERAEAANRLRAAELEAVRLGLLRECACGRTVPLSSRSGVCKACQKRNGRNRGLSVVRGA